MRDKKAAITSTKAALKIALKTAKLNRLSFVLISSMGYTGMYGPKGYGFSAVFVTGRVSILANFGNFCDK